MSAKRRILTCLNRHVICDIIRAHLRARTGQACSRVVDEDSWVDGPRALDPSRPGSRRSRRGVWSRGLPRAGVISENWYDFLKIVVRFSQIGPMLIF
jgi:hypothetical protein